MKTEDLDDEKRGQRPPAPTRHLWRGGVSLRTGLTRALLLPDEERASGARLPGFLFLFHYLLLCSLGLGM